MLSTVRGVFRDGRVELEETAPRSSARVLVTFLADDATSAEGLAGAEKRPLGFAAGQITLHSSFFEPLPEEVLEAFEGEDP